MDARTTLTLRCTACGALTQAGCNCGAPYAYVSPGEMAAKAVKDNPGKSNRAHAADLGIDEGTLRNARKSGAENSAPEKRTGRDGKKYKARKKPEPSKLKERVSRRGESMPQLERAREIVRPLMDAGKPFSCHDLEREHGDISHYTFDSAICAEKARLETLAEVVAIADFSKMTAKQKLDAAIRAHKKLLDREYDQRRIKEIGEHIKRITPDLQEARNAAFRSEQMYREFMQKQKKIMTVAEYTLVCSLLHPDSRISASDEKLRRAFQMFEPKKFPLTGEK